MNMGKNGVNVPVWALLGILLLAAFAWMSFSAPAPAAAAAVAAGAAAPGLPASSAASNPYAAQALLNDQKSVSCSYPTTGQTSYTVAAYDFGTGAGQPVTAVTYTGYVGSRFISAQSGGTAITVTPGNYVNVLVGGNASYFNSVITENIPCVGAYASTTGLGFIGQVTYNTINTTGVYNTTGGRESSIGTGGQAVNYLQLTQNTSATPGGQAYFSNPQINQFVALVKSNNTAVVDANGFNIAGCSATGIPVGIQGYATANAYKAFVCPGAIGTLSTPPQLPLLIKAVTGQDPTTGFVATVTAKLNAMNYVLGNDGIFRADGANDLGTQLVTGNTVQRTIDLK